MQGFKIVVGQCRNGRRRRHQGRQIEPQTRRRSAAEGIQNQGQGEQRHLGAGKEIAQKGQLPGNVQRPGIGFGKTGTVIARKQRVQNRPL